MDGLDDLSLFSDGLGRSDPFLGFSGGDKILSFGSWRFLVEIVGSVAVIDSGGMKFFVATAMGAVSEHWWSGTGSELGGSS